MLPPRAPQPDTPEFRSQAVAALRLLVACGVVSERFLCSCVGLPRNCAACRPLGGAKLECQAWQLVATALCSGVTAMAQLMRTIDSVTTSRIEVSPNTIQLWGLPRWILYIKKMSTEQQTAVREAARLLQEVDGFQCVTGGMQPQRVSRLHLWPAVARAVHPHVQCLGRIIMRTLSQIRETHPAETETQLSMSELCLR